mgnify:CR=1 FL=1
MAIIASNEEDNLPRCPESLSGIAAEIILVHSDCTDRTEEIAKKFDAQCHEQEWLGFCEQTKVAIRKTNRRIGSSTSTPTRLYPAAYGNPSLTCSPEIRLRGSMDSRATAYPGSWASGSGMEIGTQIRN